MNEKSIALITGVTESQDGSYLAELLLSKNYIVHGIVRRSSSFNTSRIDHLIEEEKYKDKFFFHHGDVTDSSNVERLIEDLSTTEIYNLAAQSHVAVSFQIPEYTAQVDALGTLRFLEAIRSKRYPVGSIKPLLANFMEKSLKLRKMKKPLFIRGLHMRCGQALQLLDSG